MNGEIELKDIVEFNSIIGRLSSMSSMADDFKLGGLADELRSCAITLSDFANKYIESIEEDDG